MASNIAVTATNFSDLFGEISSNIQKCSFYSIDCEFTGLKNENFSLFDSPKERYHKMKDNIKNYFIPQFGLTTFTHCEYSNIEFLIAHGFNWQTLFEDGLHFVSWDEEKTLLEKLEADTLWFDILSDVSFHYSDILQNLQAQVSAWQTYGSDNDLVLEIPSNNPYVLYLISRVIPERFNNLVVERTGRRTIAVRNSLQNGKTQKILNPRDVIEDYFLGFSKVIKLLISEKKPMVGHNIFLDLAMMFQQFMGPLPGNYESYKLALNRTFPVIFDTKHISFEMRMLVPREKEWPTNSLEELYNFFTQDQYLLKPSVSGTPNKNFHNAGFDAFSTGFCFIRFAYLKSIWSDYTKTFVFPMIPRTSTELFSAISVYSNRINIIRCQVNWIHLDGRDPTGKRPDILLVESKNRLDLLKLRDIISCYSCVDLKILSRNRVLLAIGSFVAARQIERSLHSNTIRVTRYNRFLHDRYLLFTGLASVSFVATLLYSWMRWR